MKKILVVVFIRRGELLSLQIKKSLYLNAWLFIAFLLFGAGLLFVSIEMSLPDTVISMNPTSRSFFQKVLPQGWGFFTKNPESPVLVIKAADSSAKPVMWPLMQAKVGFGFDRIGRVQGIQYGMISHYLPDVEKWQSAENVKNHGLKYYYRPNTSPHPQLKGRYVVQYLKFNDWGLGTGNSVLQPYKEIGVDIQ